MDPLSVLRMFVINNELDQVVESGSSLNFGGRFSFENTAPTAYRSGQGKGEFYDLQSVLFYVKNLERNYGEYIKAAKDKGVMQVKLLDRKDLVEYLTGKREASDYIQLSGVPSAAGDEAPAKRARIDGGDVAAAAPGGGHDIEMVPAVDAAAEHSALRTIIANERQLRDRNTMLSVPGRSFKRVLDLLDGVVKEEIARNLMEEREKEARRKKEEIERQKREGVAPQPSGRYQRESAPDGALQQIGAKDLGLQQVGFAAGPSTAQPQAPIPAPPPPQATQKPKEPTPKSGSRPSDHIGNAKDKAKPQLLRNPTPLIMVPPGGSALLNMLNAPEFLADGNYKTPQDAAAAGAKLPEGKWYHTIYRKIGRNKPIKYHVTDKEPKSKEDWARVVGVFCLGKPWQFKQFPFVGASKGDLVDTFQRVCGVYLHYSDEPIDAQVKKWNVKMIKIGRHSREGDADAVRAFWTQLDGFIKAHKKGLIY